jgi:hypothetical protein
MTILDTNVPSAPMVQTLDRAVVAWLDHRPRTFWKSDAAAQQAGDVPEISATR